jgi:hypothetical protein
MTCCLRTGHAGQLDLLGRAHGERPQEPCCVRLRTGIGCPVRPLRGAGRPPLDAAAQSADELCRHAQHALGMAGFGSRIYRERTAVGIYIGSQETRFDTTPLILDGAEVLWFVGTASVDEVRQLIRAAEHAMLAMATS